MDTTAATIELRPTANASQFTRTYAVAETKETPVRYSHKAPSTAHRTYPQNLSLRPLKKHTNIRIGKKVDLTGYPSKSSLFSISNKHGWFFAGNENSAHHMLLVPILESR
jgi:hypothetical protein